MVYYQRIPLRRYARRFQDGGAVDSSFAPVPKAGQTIEPTNVAADVAAWPGRAANLIGDVTGVNDALKAWRGEMTEDEARNFALMSAAGLVLPELKGARAALGVAEKVAPEITQGIRAYHGSPHDFERFDTSKIGTGEGAQVYGHGLYFAENPAVAEDYKQSLSRTGPWEWDGKPLRRGDTEADIPSHVWHALGWLEGNQRPGESVAELNSPAD